MQKEMLAEYNGELLELVRKVRESGELDGLELWEVRFALTPYVIERRWFNVCDLLEEVTIERMDGNEMVEKFKRKKRRTKKP